MTRRGLGDSFVVVLLRDVYGQYAAVQLDSPMSEAAVYRFVRAQWGLIDYWPLTVDDLEPGGDGVRIDDRFD